jgi:hypothetical protein
MQQGTHRTWAKSGNSQEIEDLGCKAVGVKNIYSVAGPPTFPNVSAISGSTNLIFDCPLIRFSLFSKPYLLVVTDDWGYEEKGCESRGRGC